MMQAAKERQIILDPACGSRMFYHDKNNPHVLFGDVRKAEFVAMDRGRARKIVIDPDVVLDFKNLPFVTGAFKIVTFDPPHLLRGGASSWLVKKYGKLPTNWEDDLRQGFAECMRVLDFGGILNFKWSEVDIPASKVIEISGMKPVVWTKFPKAAGTHWIQFVKGAEHVEL